ncbi:MAG: AcrR family transcriptional regulator [Myxococcota bacterium]|jgi:AcrR family transcriptional regulator
MTDDTQSNQRRILDAAKQLFLTKGFNGSNLRDIAREAQVSMGGIYHHFASKEEIYTSLLQGSDVATDMLQVMELLRSDAFPENLAAVGDAIAGTVRKHRETFKLFYIDVLEFQGKHVKPLIQQFRGAFGEMSATLLEPRKDELADVHPAVIMRVILDVFIHTRLEEAMLEQPLAETLGLTDEQVTSQVAQLLLHGILKR